jgi:hypothetical protein
MSFLKLDLALAHTLEAHKFARLNGFCQLAKRRPQAHLILAYKADVVSKS